MSTAFLGRGENPEGFRELGGRRMGMKTALPMERLQMVVAENLCVRVRVTRVRVMQGE